MPKHTEPTMQDEGRELGDVDDPDLLDHDGCVHAACAHYDEPCPCGECERDRSGLIEPWYFMSPMEIIEMRYIARGQFKALAAAGKEVKP